MIYCLFRFNIFSKMAYIYHVDFGLKRITGVRSMTLKKHVKIKKNVEAAKKCYEFGAAVDRELDSPETMPVVPVKSHPAPWLYGPACSLANRGVIYPCRRYRCSIPCPCRLCQKPPAHAIQVIVVTAETVLIFWGTTSTSIRLSTSFASIALRWLNASRPSTFSFWDL
jgi:hypothetical protein